ncbi:MAG: hypothetical protein HYY18_19585 [Planctomycetes bacterium]|nr:hypothetical protein [Planctomycetota bacterium]
MRVFLKMTVAALAAAAALPGCGGCRTECGGSQGGTAPAPLRALRVLEEKTAVVDPSGGAIELQGGIRFVFPAGALPRNGEVTVRRLDPAAFCPHRPEVSLVLDCRATGHAVILTGYTKAGTYLGVNPQGPNSTKGVTLTEFTEADLGITWALRQTYAAISLPGPPDPGRRKVTLNIPPGAAWFQGTQGPQGQVCLFTWDGSNPGGVSWSKKPDLAAKGDGEICRTVPGDVTFLQIGLQGAAVLQPRGGFEVVNADLNAAHDVSIIVEAFNMTDGGKKVAVAPGQAAIVLEGRVDPDSKWRFAASIEIRNLRPPEIKTAQTFEIRSTLYVDSYAADTANFGFTLDPDVQLPLVGSWTGTAMGMKMTLAVASQSGQDWSGTYAFQRETFGMDGTWKAETGCWELRFWELTDSPPAKMGFVGSLMPEPGGRLRLTAPGCVLSKEGVNYDDAAADDYKLVEEYLRILKEGGAPK